MFGNGNANLFRGNDGADEMAGGGGEDSLYGGYGSDTLIGGEGADLLDGGAGSDAASYERSETGLAVNLSYSSRNTGEAAGDIFVDIEQLIGSDYNDSLTGTDSSNWLTGGAGADRLWGLDGADVLIGGDGNDTLDGGDGVDSLTGGADDDTYITDGRDIITEAAGGGVDTVQTSAGYTLAANLENLVVTGTAIYAIGNELANRLTGNAADNVLSGGAGEDTIAGGGGADRIIGGGGTDLMQGGKGDGAADSFEFSAVSESATGAARDIIEDFVSGSDRIHLAAIDANSTTAGDQAFLFSGATARAHAVWFAKTAEGIILRADIDGNTTADFEVLLKGGASVTAADFIL